MSATPRARRRCGGASIVSSAVALACVAAADACAQDRQLQTGSASCSPACNTETTAACLAYESNVDVCTFQNASSVTAGCPLVESSGCFYQCLPWAQGAPEDTFTFYVTSASSTDASDWSSDKLRQNQQFVRSIGVMEMPARIKYVSVDVTVGSNVANLTLANINMATLAITSPTIRVTQSPPTLQSLSLVNAQLTRLPVDMCTLPALTSLDLSRNLFVGFSRDYSMENLRHLSLRDNNLTIFEAAYPALESLDLSGNQLEAIPTKVFLFPNLKSLDITRNPLDQALLEPSQYEFLIRLPSLSIGSFKTEVDCQEANKKFLKASVVCVMESKELLVIKKSSLTWYIVIPSIVTAIVALGLFSLWYSRRKKRNANLLRAQQSTPKTTTVGDEDTHYVEMGSNSDGKPARKSMGLSTSSLWADDDLLAWQVSYRQSRLLASKRLLKDHLTRQKTQAFVTEIKLAAQLDHPSIVQFVGVAWTVESDLQALFEYMANGDLRSYLDATRSDPACMGWDSTKLQMAIDMAEALVYVHSFVPALVHRDIKSKNVLLGDDMKAKLSDFGASRFQSENGTMTAGVGTGKWLAPEVLAGSNDYDHMCDIYSFGVVLSEMDTHAIPYVELEQADVATLQMVLAGAVRPRFSSHCPPEIRELADRCLSFDPKDRPNAMEIAFALRILSKQA